jgi:hypothetical protein
MLASEGQRSQKIVVVPYPDIRIIGQRGKYQKCSIGTELVLDTPNERRNQQAEARTIQGKRAALDAIIK